MLRLVINNKDVELYENAPVNLKFQFSDVEKINNPLASYSQSFRVPLTQNNVDIFGHLDQVTEVGGLDLRVCACRLNSCRTRTPSWTGSFR